jgi:RNA polymerase sigma factor (sigma-70 family)
VEATLRDLKTFIARCAEGDLEARAEFQERYGSLIYTFPVRICHLPAEEAGDFYLYVFEEGRVFKRLKTFEGRHGIRFENFLAFVVLRDLYREWQRRKEWVDIIPLDTPLLTGHATAEPWGQTVQDVLASEEPSPEDSLVEADIARQVAGVFQQVAEESKLMLKLLALGVIDLEPDDVYMIARLASRAIPETEAMLDEVRSTLAAEASKAQDKWQVLYTVSYWIHKYQRQIKALEEEISGCSARGDTAGVQTLMEHKTELVRKSAKRYRQQARLWKELRRCGLRPSNQDIAKIFNMPQGTVSAKIFRAREAFGQKLAAADDAQA